MMTYMSYSHIGHNARRIQRLVEIYTGIFTK